MRLRWRRQDAQLAREEAGDPAEAREPEEPVRTEAAP
jgi:hypothetical protein